MLNLSGKLSREQKRVTINNINAYKVKHSSDVSRASMKHVPDQELLKENYNPGMISTAAKRDKPKGIIIDVEASDINSANKIRQAIKDFNVPGADNAVTKWSKIDSDIFLSRQMKR